MVVRDGENYERNSRIYLYFKSTERRQDEEKRRFEVEGEASGATSPSRFFFSFVIFVVALFCLPPRHFKKPQKYLF
jgi:hypothetical protein